MNIFRYLASFIIVSTLLNFNCEAQDRPIGYWRAHMPYNKVEGMSDVGMEQIGYDTTTNTVILAYQNDNIDLFKNNSFFNIPDLKNKMVTGSKIIHSIYTYNGVAYLSTDIGIVAIDLTAKNIKETYVFVK